MPGPRAKSVPRKFPVFLGLALTLTVLIMYLAGNPLLEAMELKTYDMRLRAASPEKPAENVVIAAIDEKSLAALGRWPWSRATMGRLVGRLDRLGARVIAFDVFFSEAENSGLLDQIARLEAEKGYTEANSPYTRIREALVADSQLGRAIARSGRVVLSMVFLMSEDETRHFSMLDARRALAAVEDQAIHAIKDSGGGRLDFPMREPRGLLVNLPELRAAAKYTGHINSLPDRDGVLRWVPLVMRYQDRFFPSGDVQAVRAYLGATKLTLHTTAYGISALAIGDRMIETDEYGQALIRYYGPEKTFPTFSVADILDGRVGPGQIKDKIVLIGATAKGIGDVRVTPYGTAFPGVEIRATIAQNLLRNDFIHRPGWMMLLDLAVLLGVGLALSLLLPRLALPSGAALTLALFALGVGAALYFFHARLIWLNVVHPSVLMLLLFMSSTIVKYFTTETERRQIKSAFQFYVPVKVVDEIMRDVGRLRLGGEKRELTVLFSDIRGFTTVSETLSPEELVKFLNVYLTEMTEQVFRNDGLLDKYVGDAIMAVYGAPIHRPDHALLACRTALDMMRALRDLQAHWRRAGKPALDIGIGISTGPMVVGNMGAQNRFDYTVVGDAVNLGSRIEDLNKVYGTHILLSEFTFRQVQDEFRNVREVDVTRVRGRQEPVRIFELIPESEYRDLAWLDDFARAYRLFRADKPDQALPLFERLYKHMRDPVSQHYAYRCQTPRRRQEDRL